MAEKQQGFECEFVEKPPKVVQSECPVCLLVLREPYQATCCGYSFCQVCIERVKARNLSCPCCKAEEFNHYPNKGLQRSLNEFIVQCSNRQQGCQWEGELGQLDNHLNFNPTEEKQLEGCQFSHIKCIHCSDIFLRSEIQLHQKHQCSIRPFSCQYCEDFNSSYKVVTQIHWPICEYYPVLCTNECGQTLQRQNLQSHITTDCPLTIIDCDFQHVGCEVRLPRKDMPAHLQEGVVHHLSLQAASYKQVVARLEDENKELKQQVRKLTQDLQSQKICTPICPVEFTLMEYEQKRKNKELWKSQPFYTHQKGYKIRLFFDAGSKHSRDGKYIPLCLILMKGEFDNELTWPFTKTFKVELLNQHQSKIKNLTSTIYFTEEVGMRVTSGDESRLMVGTKNIHPELVENYVKNDCLKVRIDCTSTT